jgi:hypothetical protein
MGGGRCLFENPPLALARGPRGVSPHPAGRTWVRLPRCPQLASIGILIPPARATSAARS